jgi:hypothetical protein
MSHRVPFKPPKTGAGKKDKKSTKFYVGFATTERGIRECNKAERDYPPWVLRILEPREDILVLTPLMMHEAARLHAEYGPHERAFRALLALNARMRYTPDGVGPAALEIMEMIDEEKRPRFLAYVESIVAKPEGVNVVNAIRNDIESPLPNGPDA